MIRQLRDRHRTIATALAVALPIAYAAILAGRPVGTGPPAPAGDSTALEPADSPFTLLVEPRITGRLLAAAGDSAAAAIQVVPSRDPGVPDLLVYWVRAVQPDTPSLPPDARLLAALRGSRTQVLPLPEPGRPPGGTIILYSHGWRRVMAVVPLRGVP
jgi:hypothetical protein